MPESFMSVLHVDDDPLALWSFRRLFRKNNYNITPALNASDAIYWARRYNYDVAVLDMSLPDENGLELFETLKKIRPSMPVIFLTGQGDNQVLTEAISMGCMGFIEKPADPEEIKRQVQAVFKAQYKV